MRSFMIWTASIVVTAGLAAGAYVAVTNPAALPFVEDAPTITPTLTSSDDVIEGMTAEELAERLTLRADASVEDTTLRECTEAEFFDPTVDCVRPENFMNLLPVCAENEIADSDVWCRIEETPDYAQQVDANSAQLEADNPGLRTATEQETNVLLAALNGNTYEYSGGVLELPTYNIPFFVVGDTVEFSGNRAIFRTGSRYIDTAACMQFIGENAVSTVTVQQAADLCNIQCTVTDVTIVTRPHVFARRGRYEMIFIPEADQPSPPRDTCTYTTNSTARQPQFALFPGINFGFPHRIVFQNRALLSALLANENPEEVSVQEAIEAMLAVADTVEQQLATVHPLARRYVPQTATDTELNNLATQIRSDIAAIRDLAAQAETSETPDQEAEELLAQTRELVFLVNQYGERGLFILTEELDVTGRTVVERSLVAFEESQEAAADSVEFSDAEYSLALEQAYNELLHLVNVFSEMEALDNAASPFLARAQAVIDAYRSQFPQIIQPGNLPVYFDPNIQLDDFTFMRGTDQADAGVVNYYQDMQRIGEGEQPGNSNPFQRILQPQS